MSSLADSITALRRHLDVNEVPPGGRVWVVMDHYGPDLRRKFIEERLNPKGPDPASPAPPRFDLLHAEEYGRADDPGSQAAAYLYVRK